MPDLVSNQHPLYRLTSPAIIRQRVAYNPLMRFSRISEVIASRDALRRACDGPIAGLFGAMHEPLAANWPNGYPMNPAYLRPPTDDPANGRSFRISRLEPTSALPADLIDLVRAIGRQPPYSYSPDEIEPVERWLGALVRHGELTLLAHNRVGTVIGYCITTRLADPSASDSASPAGWATVDDTVEPTGTGSDDDLPDLGVDPASTRYLSELGVAADTRRSGVGGELVATTLESLPAQVEALVVRTLANNHPAIALYRQFGFTVMPGIEQKHHGRARIFLIRRGIGQA